MRDQFDRASKTAWRSRLAFSVGPALLLLMSGLVWLPEAAPAQEPGVSELDTAADGLAGEIRERFELVHLRDGWLLRPLAGEVERAVEISDAGAAVEGQPVSSDELRELLGDDDAELVLRLLELEGRERSRVLELEGTVQEDRQPEETRKRHRRHHRSHRRDTQITVGSQLTVEKDETARDVVVFGAPLDVQGQVIGDAVAIGGSVTVSGKVTEDVAAIGGSVHLEPGAEVLGDVVSVGGRVEGEEEATVLGQVIEVPFGPNFSISGWPGWHFWEPDWWQRGRGFSPMGLAWDAVWWVFGTVLLVLLAFLVLLLARQPMARVGRRVTAEPWKSGLVGLVTEILFVPLLIMVVVILCVSIIGIPLLILVPFVIIGCVLIAFLGYCAVASRLGNVVENRFGWKLDSPYLVLLLGIVLVQIWSLIGDLFDLGWGPMGVIAAMFIAFGCLVQYAAWTVGLGAAVLTRFGTAEGWRGAPQDALPETAESSGLSEGQGGPPAAPPDDRSDEEPQQED